MWLLVRNSVIMVKIVGCLFVSYLTFLASFTTSVLITLYVLKKNYTVLFFLFFSMKVDFI